MAILRLSRSREGVARKKVERADREWSRDIATPLGMWTPYRTHPNWKAGSWIFPSPISRNRFSRVSRQTWFLHHNCSLPHFRRSRLGRSHHLGLTSILCASSIVILAWQAKFTLYLRRFRMSVRNCGGPNPLM